MEEERALRIGVVIAGHLMWLSTFALRIVGRGRERWMDTAGTWWVEYYPTLVWTPLLVAFFVFPLKLDLPDPLPTVGFVLAAISAVLGATAMWTLGRFYGVRMGLFEGHPLRTRGVYALCRHPMYLGIIGYHIGATLTLQSAFLLVVTVAILIPYTVIRIIAEERVLAAGFGKDFEAYRDRVPPILPSPL